MPKRKKITLGDYFGCYIRSAQYGWFCHGQSHVEVCPVDHRWCIEQGHGWYKVWFLLSSKGYPHSLNFWQHLHKCCVYIFTWHCEVQPMDIISLCSLNSSTHSIQLHCNERNKSGLLRPATSALNRIKVYLGCSYFTVHMIMILPPLCLNSLLHWYASLMRSTVRWPSPSRRSMPTKILGNT